MTPTKYYFSLIAKSFGIDRRNKRLVEASSEMGLLREAEYQLGRMLWEKIEPVEELSVEYWNLRKCVTEYDKQTALIDELNEKLSKLHARRAEILNELSPEQAELEQKRGDLLLHLEELAYQRDMLVRRAKDIRRTHEGLLTKIEVLERDGHSAEEYEHVMKEIDELKAEFRSLKDQRDGIAKEMEKGDRVIDTIQEQIQQSKQEKRDRAALIFNEIGNINRQLSNVRSDMGNNESQIRHLQMEVGRYISRYHKRNAGCAEVAKHARTLIEVMRMLRISIAMNHRLADFK